MGRKPTALLATGLAALMAGSLLFDSPVVVAERARVEAAVLPATPRAVGRVARLEVEEGARVRAGQVLAALEAGDMADQVALSEAALAAAEAGLPAMRMAAALQDVQRGATVEQAEAALAAARADLAAERARAAQAASAAAALRGARARGVVASQDLEAAEADARAAAAVAEAAHERVRAADSTLALARRQAGLGTVERAGLARSEAEIQQARSALAIARRRREQAVVTAPVDGVVARKLVAVGDQVLPGQPVYTVLAEAAPWIRAEVRELDAAEVREGARAEVTIDALPDRRFTGRVARVGVVVEPPDATVGRQAPAMAVTIALDATGHGLVPGMTARARIARPGAGWWDRVSGRTAPERAP